MLAESLLRVYYGGIHRTVASGFSVGKCERVTMCPEVETCMVEGIDICSRSVLSLLVVYCGPEESRRRICIYGIVLLVHAEDSVWVES